MQHSDPLSSLALDALPLNVAVLDEDGTILLTNRAWEEFEGISGDASAVGANYLAAIDPDVDQRAARSLAGLEAVLAGETEEFTLEYPCHSPDEKRWFLLRATSLPSEAQGSAVVAHIDITERKLAELDTQAAHRELELLLERLQGLVCEVMEAVLQADSRAAIEETICSQLADVPAYEAVWVGAIDRRREAVVPSVLATADGTWTSVNEVDETGTDTPSAPAGVPDLEPMDIDLATHDPVIQTLEEGEPHVSTVDSTAKAGIHAVVATSAAAQEAGDSRRLTEAAQTPASSLEDGPGDGLRVGTFSLAHGDSQYGVLSIYARRDGAFDERERAILQVLARVASTAINAVEGQRILAADTVVELDVTLDNETGLLYHDLSVACECTVTYEGAVYQPDGSVLLLLVAEGSDHDVLLEAATEHDDVRRAGLVTATDDAAVLEVAVDAPPLVDVVAARGAETTSLEAESGTVRATVHVPTAAEARAIIEDLGERHPSLSLVGRREHERREQTETELKSDIESRLTDRQRLALRKAYLGGFFNWPREASGEDLAGSMDISPSTYHQHLRAAERKVLDAIFGE